MELLPGYLDLKEKKPQPNVHKFPGNVGGDVWSEAVSSGCLVMTHATEDSPGTDTPLVTLASVWLRLLERGCDGSRARVCLSLGQMGVGDLFGSPAISRQPNTPVSLTTFSLTDINGLW